MASEDRHITRIEKTEALFRTNGDHGQSAILTDQSEEWVYYNDDKTLLYYAAAQKTWDGAAWAYVNNDFGQVTLHDDLLVEEYIKRSTGTDDRIRFENDKISIEAGGAVAAVFEDDRVYSGLKKFGFGKTTLEAWGSTWAAAQVGGTMSLFCTPVAEGASSVVGIGNNFYYDGANKKMVNDQVTTYVQRDGNHIWYADAAGAADTGYTPTERMRLTSEDLTTASVRLGLATTTPLLNVAGASGDFTGYDGMHIKSRASTSKAALVIEGSVAPNGWADEASIVFATHSGAGSDTAIMQIAYGQTTQLLKFRRLDDDLTATDIVMVDGANDDFYSVFWTDYSAISTITGWSSFTLKQIWYKRIGKFVIVNFNLEGTSNSATTSFTLPVSSNARRYHTLSVAHDNGSDDGVCQIILDNSSTVNILRGTNYSSSAGWTASGAKKVEGQLWYQIA